MLKFSNFISPKSKKIIVKDNSMNMLEYIPFVEMKISKLIN